MTSSDRLAGGRPTPQPSDGGTRQVPDPAAGTAPVSRRAARASVPGGAGSAPRKADPAGKTPRRAVSQDSLPDGDPGPETRRPGRASVRAGDQTPSPPLSPPGAAKGAAGAARDADRHQRPAGPVAMSPAGAVTPREGAAPAGSTGRTWTIALPAGLELLSLNDRLHWRERHKRGEVIRNAACWAARQAKVPQLSRAGVVIEYQPPDRRHRDADNPVASAKAAIDGLVIARCLPDDECPRYVTGIYCTIGEIFPKGRLVLHLTEVTL